MLLITDFTFQYFLVQSSKGVFVSQCYPRLGALSIMLQMFSDTKQSKAKQKDANVC